MKIGIISDTHGHEKAFSDACEKFFGGAELILHAGDVLYHGPRNPRKADYNPAGLVSYINDIKIPVIIARGNCDSSVDESCLAVPVCYPYAFVRVNEKNIVIMHGDSCMTAEEKDALAKKLHADLFVSGHIHTTVLEKRGATVFLNPGSAALSKREDGKQTCATLENGVLRIYDIATGDVLEELAM